MVIPDPVNPGTGPGPVVNPGTGTGTVPVTTPTLPTDNT